MYLLCVLCVCVFVHVSTFVQFVVVTTSEKKRVRVKWVPNSRNINTKTETHTLFRSLYPSTTKNETLEKWGLHIQNPFYVNVIVKRMNIVTFIENIVCTFSSLCIWIVFGLDSISLYDRYPDGIVCVSVDCRYIFWWSFDSKRSAFSFGFRSAFFFCSFVHFQFG